MRVVSVPAFGSVTANACRRSHARGDLRQVSRLLLLRAMAKQCAHHVHLRVRGTGVGAALVDLLQDGGGLPQTVPEPAVARWNECGQPAGVRQRLHECLGIFSPSVEIAPVGIREPHAQRAHLSAAIPESLEDPRTDRLPVVASVSRVVRLGRFLQPSRLLSERRDPTASDGGMANSVPDEPRARVRGAGRDSRRRRAFAIGAAGC